MNREELKRALEERLDSLEPFLKKIEADPELWLMSVLSRAGNEFRRKSLDLTEAILALNEENEQDELSDEVSYALDLLESLEELSSPSALLKMLMDDERGKRVLGLYGGIHGGPDLLEKFRNLKLPHKYKM